MTTRPLRPIDPRLAARIAYQVAEIKRKALTGAAANVDLQAEQQRRYDRLKREMGW